MMKLILSFAILFACLAIVPTVSYAGDETDASAKAAQADLVKRHTEIDTARAALDSKYLQIIQQGDSVQRGQDLKKWRKDMDKLLDDEEKLNDEEIRRHKEQLDLKQMDLDKKQAELTALQKDIKWKKQEIARLRRDAKQNEKVLNQKAKEARKALKQK